MSEPATPSLSAVKPEAPSLKSLAVQGSTWTLVEYGGSQVLRLASNVVLAHLLAPDFFGLMLLVGLFMQALEMFSDLGLGQSVIQNERGEDPDFLNTAWTMQVLRGMLLFGGALLVTWPAAWVYGKPELLYLLPVTAVSTLVAGFNSTNLYLLNRRLILGRLAFINLGTQVLTILCTMALAWMWRSVWALVSSYLVASAVRLLASHFLCPGPRNRFRWDSEGAHALFRFGRWIFVSTVFGFLASRGDQVILGYFLATGLFGVYGFASFISQGVLQAIYTVSGRVLFPVYTRLALGGQERLRRQTIRIRALLMAVSLPPVCALSVFGPQIIRLLYDERYQDAGWILQILAAGTVVSVVGSVNGSILLALGDSFRYMVLMGARTVALLLAMGVGGWSYGTPGLIVGVATHELLLYPIASVCVRRYGVWLPWLDFAGYAAAGTLIGVGWLIWN